MDAMTTRYSVANALALAQCSLLAYGNEAAIKAGLPGAVGGNRTLEANQYSGVPRRLRGHDRPLFPRQRTPLDWIHNSQIGLVPFRERGLIHFGFRNALASVSEEIEATLAQWAGRGRTLWITGHSLGGALAMLAAAHLRYPADPTKTLPRPIAGVYTFGQPRVGTPAFCQASDAGFGQVYFRHVNNEDVVPRIPPRELAYWHLDRIRYFDRNKKMHEDPAWWHMLLDRIAAGVQALRELQERKPAIGAIRDHSMTAYIAAITANLPS